MAEVTPTAAVTLRYLASAGPLRNSLRYIDDAAADLGISSDAMREALEWLVGQGLAVCQDVEEESDALTGRRGQAFRLTLAGERAVSHATGRP